MFDTTDELMTAIQLGEDTALEVKDLRYKDSRVEAPHRNSIADEFAVRSFHTFSADAQFESFYHVKQLFLGK